MCPRRSYSGVQWEKSSPQTIRGNGFPTVADGDDRQNLEFERERSARPGPLIADRLLYVELRNASALECGVWNQIEAAI